MGVWISYLLKVTGWQSNHRENLNDLKMLLRCLWDAGNSCAPRSCWGSYRSPQASKLIVSLFWLVASPLNNPGSATEHMKLMTSSLGPRHGCRFHHILPYIFCGFVQKWVWIGGFFWRVLWGFERLAALWTTVTLWMITTTLKYLTPSQNLHSCWGVITCSAIWALSSVWNISLIK